MESRGTRKQERRAKKTRKEMKMESNMLRDRMCKSVDVRIQQVVFGLPCLLIFLNVYAIKTNKKNRL